MNHIIHNEMTNIIRKKNIDSASEIANEIVDDIREHNNKLESSPGQDTAMIALIYVRKGNDIVSMGTVAKSNHTSCAP